MEKINSGEPQAGPADVINGRVVNLDILDVDQLEVLHAACLRRYKRARFELAVVQDVLLERQDPEDDLGLTV
jgi:hypothetical protein